MRQNIFSPVDQGRGEYLDRQYIRYSELVQEKIWHHRGDPKQAVEHTIGIRLRGVTN